MIETNRKKFSGIKLILQYEMKNEAGKIVALAESAHCFLDKDGKMLRLAKQFPAFYQALVMRSERVRVSLLSKVEVIQCIRLMKILRLSHIIPMKK